MRKYGWVLVVALVIEAAAFLAFAISPAEAGASPNVSLLPGWFVTIATWLQKPGLYVSVWLGVPSVASVIVFICGYLELLAAGLPGVWYGARLAKRWEPVKPKVTLQDFSHVAHHRT
jgi:hypothetical protein